MDTAKENKTGNTQDCEIKFEMTATSNIDLSTYFHCLTETLYKNPDGMIHTMHI